MSADEVRIAADGEAYTYQEFVEHYGEMVAKRRWREASVGDRSAPSTAAATEHGAARIAAHGGAYTYGDFVKLHGEMMAKLLWREASVSGRLAPSNVAAT